VKLLDISGGGGKIEYLKANGLETSYMLCSKIHRGLQHFTHFNNYKNSNASCKAYEVHLNLSFAVASS
jgi:hypothetical protein